MFAVSSVSHQGQPLCFQVRPFQHNAISRAAAPQSLASSQDRRVLLSLLTFGQRQEGHQCSLGDWDFKPHLPNAGFEAHGAAP